MSDARGSAWRVCERRAFTTLFCSSATNDSRLERQGRLINPCRAPVLVAFGERLHVQQLPSSHDEVTDGELDGCPASGLHDDEQQARRVVLLWDRKLGH
jgi:hypothetical protein